MADDRIRDLSYKIKQVELEIKNLEKTLEVKRKHRMLEPDIEENLSGQISARRNAIAGLQAEIRKIENESARSQNLSEGFGV